MPVSASIQRNVFGPWEIARLSLAYDAALSSVTEDSSRYAGSSARELRRQLASAIIAKAKEGHLDPGLLKEAALASLGPPRPSG